MDLKPRPLYLDKLLAFKDTEFIKVLVGMRRCGKSSLLQLFSQHLVDEGVPCDRIIEMNFEAAEHLDVSDYASLLDRVEQRAAAAAPAEGRFYLMLDEVQLVAQWEKAVNALRVRGDFDIYLTGSNAYLLSSQLATLLSGRYVEVDVYPLSFRELAAFVDCDHPDEALLARYMAYGGLPPVVEQGEVQALAKTVLSGIYDTVFVKDVAQHIQVRNQPVFSDIARYLADTSGSRVSVSRIEKRLASAHRKTSGETIERYIQALVDSFLFYRAKRIDLKGGSILQGLEKYYASDLGIRNMLLGFPSGDYGHVLEGVVYNELVVRGYEVRVGKLDSIEVDFVATRDGEASYIQVSASLLDEATRKREMEPLRRLPPGKGERLVVTLDRLGLGDDDGVQVANAIDWLLS